MAVRNIQDYGNKLTISGMVLSSGDEVEVIYFPSTELTKNQYWKAITPTQEELLAIFNQLDTLDITGFEKAVLRKSQRNIDQVIAWQVFRRDNFRCVYCGCGSTPLTVDHLVLWEDLGDTVPANLVSACKKCNHTRHSQSIVDFLASDYYQNNCYGNVAAYSQQVLIGMYEEAVKLPLRKPRKR